MGAFDKTADWIQTVYRAYVDGHEFIRDSRGYWSLNGHPRKAPFAFRGYKTDAWMANVAATRDKEGK